MSMFGINFAQMLAPQGSSQGRGFSGAVDGEGFIAALQQVAGEKTESGDSDDNLLAALFEQLGLDQPETKQQFLQWLQGEQGAEQLEQAWTDQRFDKDELIGLLKNFAVNVAEGGEVTSAVAARGQLQANEQKMAAPHSQDKPQVPSGQAQAGPAQEPKSNSEVAHLQGQGQKLQSEAQHSQAQTQNARSEVPHTQGQAKMPQNQTQTQAQLLAVQDSQSQRQTLQGSRLFEVEGTSRFTEVDPAVTKRELPARVELEALLTQALRRGREGGETALTSRTTQQVLDESQTVSLRQSGIEKGLGGLEKRFNELLGFQPRSEGQGQGEQSRVQFVAPQSLTSAPAALAGSGMGDAGQRDFEGFFSRESAQPLSTAGGNEQGAVFSLENARPAAMSAAPVPSAPGMFQTPSGMLMQENQLIDQVARNINLQGNGDRSQMTLRLYPEELGELKLELVMEKGGIKAHIQAQTAQVQEVLERHMPRLREAFAQQGLQLDDVEVSLDSSKSGGRDSLFGQDSQERHNERRFGQRPVAPETAMEHERQASLSGMNQGSGINLHI